MQKSGDERLLRTASGQQTRVIRAPVFSGHEPGGLPPVLHCPRGQAAPHRPFSLQLDGGLASCRGEGQLREKNRKGAQWDACSGSF